MTQEQDAEQKQQFAVQKQDQAKYFAANPTAAFTDGAAMALLQSVYLTNLPKQFEWAKDIGPHGAMALATAASQTGLNPLLGHLIMLGGNIYLTEKGCHHIANTNDDFDGYDLEPVPKADFEAYGFAPDDIAFKCSVYRKNRSRPTVAYGRANVRNVLLPAAKTHWLSEMAQKRAIQRTIVRAFALPFGSADEMHEDMDVTPHESRVVPQQTQALPYPTPTTADRLRKALESKVMPTTTLQDASIPEDLPNVEESEKIPMASLADELRALAAQGTLLAEAKSDHKVESKK